MLIGDPKFPTTEYGWHGGDIEINTSDSDIYEATSALRSKEVIASAMPDLSREQLRHSRVTRAPRWLLARTFESLRSEERKSRNPDVAVRSIRNAMGGVEFSCLGYLPILSPPPFVLTGEILHFALAKSRLIIEGGLVLRRTI